MNRVDVHGAAPGDTHPVFRLAEPGAIRRRQSGARGGGTVAFTAAREIEVLREDVAMVAVADALGITSTATASAESTPSVAGIVTSFASWVVAIEHRPPHNRPDATCEYGPITGAPQSIARRSRGTSGGDRFSLRLQRAGGRCGRRTSFLASASGGVCATLDVQAEVDERAEGWRSSRAERHRPA